MTRSRIIAWTGIAWLCCAALAYAESPRPEDLLQQQFELQRLPSSNIWAVRLEIELRTHWAELPRHREAIALLDQGLTEQVQVTRRAWLQAERNEKTLRVAIAALEPSNRERARLEGQLAIIRRGLTPPERLGDREDVRRLLIALAEQRNALWLTAQAIRQKTPLLAEAYDKLAEQPEVAALLRKIGGSHRLGPARNYADDLKRLEQGEQPFLTEWLPLFMSGSRLRFTALANESTPITFTWTSSPEPSFITATQAESLGIEFDAKDDQEEIVLEKRTFRTRQGVIPRLRLGKYELHAVKVLILPPEAEFAGARLSPVALAGYSAEAQPNRLRLVMTPQVSRTPSP